MSGSRLRTGGCGARCRDALTQGAIMNGRGLITATMRELERVKVIEAVIEGRLRCFQAAERLDLCERQVSRLCRRYEADGPAGLVSGKRGKPSNRELPIDLRARAMALVRERYADFGPTLACEKLAECHGVVLPQKSRGIRVGYRFFEIGPRMKLKCEFRR